MPLSQLGLNFTALRNMGAPNLSISNNTTDLLNNAPILIRDLTRNTIGYPIVGVFFLILYMILSDKTPFSDFGYSNTRSLCLSLIISSIFTVFLIQLQFIFNFKILAFLLVATAISAIYHVSIISKK